MNKDVISGNEQKAGKVSEVSIAWLNEAALTLKESSIIKYEDILKNYILPVYGEMDFSMITNTDLVNFVDELRRTGGIKKQGLSPATISEVITTMNLLRSYVQRKNLIVLFNPHCVNIKHDRHDIRVFSIYEENKLIKYLKKKDDLTSVGILICLYTGIRIGELCALKWNDVNLSERTMKIGKTMQRLRVYGKEHKTEVKILDPKSTHSVRIIPIPKVLGRILKPHFTKDAFVLTGDTEKFVEPRVMQKRFKKILQTCGIKDANFHATRHTFATRCVELDFDIKSLSEILGHSSVTITLNRYVHPTMKLKRENMNKLKELF